MASRTRHVLVAASVAGLAIGCNHRAIGSDDGGTGDSDTSVTDTVTATDDGSTGSTDCEEELVHEGDLTIDSDPAPELACVVRVEGNVYVKGTTLTDLTAVHRLREVTGAVWVEGNALLVSLSGLESLETAEVGLLINGNSVLQDLGALAALRLVGSVSIEGNDSLSDLTAFSSLEIRNDGPAYFRLSGGAVTSLSGLSSITSLTVTAPSFSVDVSDTSIQAVDGLPRLLTDADQPLSLYISDNPELLTLVGLEPPIAFGDLAIENNDALANLQGLENVSDIGWLRLVGNDALTTLEGLEGLAKADMVNIGDCWDGLEGGNKKLQSLEALAGIVEVRALSLDEDDSLTSLAGLGGIKQLETLDVRRNDALAQAVVENFASGISITQNADLCENGGDQPACLSCTPD